jgi:site-specific DNA-cytosine methylase
MPSTNARLRREAVTAEQEEGFAPLSFKIDGLITDFPRDLRLLEIPGGLLGIHKAFLNHNIRHTFVGTKETNLRHRNFYISMFPGREAEIDEWLGKNACMIEWVKDKSNVQDADVVGGGPPCQHSTQGGKPEGPDAECFAVAMAFVTVVKELYRRGF